MEKAKYVYANSRMHIAQQTKKAVRFSLEEKHTATKS